MIACQAAGVAWGGDADGSKCIFEPSALSIRPATGPCPEPAGPDRACATFVLRCNSFATSWANRLRIGSHDSRSGLCNRFGETD